MNKRTLELAKQAGAEHTQNCGVEQYYFEHDELEKFAELIVKGCIDEVKFLREHYIMCRKEANNEYDYAYVDAYQQAEDRLRLCFGVEE